MSKEKHTEKETKVIRNRNNYRMEIMVGGNTVAIAPRGTVEVPTDYEIPANLGLIEE